MVGKEMTNYTDLVHILRQLNLKYGDMAADALEAQAKRIAELEQQLNSRDDFIVKNDLWAKYVAALKVLGEKE
jgi:ABC-type transporter lipoprotein component MlaA